MLKLKEMVFRFDAGPSLFTMPELMDDLIRLSENNPQNYFNYLKLKKAVGTFLMIKP